MIDTQINYYKIMNSPLKFSYTLKIIKHIKKFHYFVSYALQKIHWIIFNNIHPINQTIQWNE